MAKLNYKKNPIFDINEQLGAKLPPQAVELEMDVLGALMLERGTEDIVSVILSAESFYKTEHQKIFTAITNLADENHPIDYHTVIEKLKKNGDLDAAGGVSYVMQLTQRVGSSAHIEYHSKIIAQKFIQRELIRLSSEIQTRSYDETEDVADVIEYAQKEIYELTLGTITKDAVNISQLLNDAIDNIEEAKNKKDGLSGVPSGFSSLDKVTSGWQNSDLVIVAARPSMGKTAFVLSMARNMTVEHKKTIAFFSLEMSSLQLITRLISSETELPSQKLRSGNLADHEWQQLEFKIKSLEKARIFVDETPGISLNELRTKCRKLKTKEDIDLIIIDYLQLMTGPKELKGNREQEVSTISRGLKGLAKELDLPVIALSQLNRSVEMRSGNKRPQLSDLRESGAIEQDADIVMFIHRPEKMGIEQDPTDGSSTRGLAQIIIAKHRNGEICDVDLRFRDDFARFEEFDGGFAAYTENIESNSFDSKINAQNEPGESKDMMVNEDFYQSLDTNSEDVPF